MNTYSTQLTERANNSLLERLRSSGYNYTPVECSKIESLSHRLLDPEISLEQETIERLRALASLSQSKIVSEKITSHRKLLGPIIVAAKKLVWPFVYSQLKGQIKAQREFNERILEQQILSLRSSAKE